MQACSTSLVVRRVVAVGFNPNILHSEGQEPAGAQRERVLDGAMAAWSSTQKVLLVTSEMCCMAVAALLSCRLLPSTLAASSNRRGRSRAGARRNERLHNVLGSDLPIL
jgi:hypothetical protein